MARNGPKWLEMVRNGPKWPKMAQNGLKWSEMVQNGTFLFISFISLFEATLQHAREYFFCTREKRKKIPPKHFKGLVQMV
jgi:hypothetical protein